MRRIIYIILAMLNACAAATVPAVVLKQGPTSTAPKVVVLRSSALFTQPIKGFVDSIDSPIVEATLDDKSDEASIRAWLVSEQPALVFALGARATLLAARALPQTPVVCAMVADYQSEDFQQLKNLVGIAFEAPPLQEFSQFKIVLPEMKRVLVIHSASIHAAMNRAQHDLAALGIELVAVQIDDESEIAAAVATHQLVDAVWMPKDPIVMTQTGFAKLREAALAAKRPLLASVTEFFAEQGAYAAVAIDFTSLGAQAAALAHERLSGRALGDSQFQTPIGASLVVNLNVAKKLAIDLPSDVLPFVRTVGSKGLQPRAKK